MIKKLTNGVSNITFLFCFEQLLDAYFEFDKCRITLKKFINIIIKYFVLAVILFSQFDIKIFT